MTPSKLILAGGSGFLGRSLIRYFTKLGFEIIVLSRSEQHSAVGFRSVTWNARTLGVWTAELEGATALINLVGRSVNCRYNARNRCEILESRVLSTRVLGEAIARASDPPKVWLNLSTATIYKHTFGTAHDESGEIGASDEANDAFSIEVATAWEEEFQRAACPHTRKITLRTAMVMSSEPGGVYQVLRRLTAFGLGGKMGSGDQYVSWIHAEDLCRAIEWLISQKDAAGLYNVAAPTPLTNADLMSLFRKILKRPVGLPASRWMLEIGSWLLRTESELVIKSRRVIPGRLLAEGFAFRFPTACEAIEEIEFSRAGGFP